MSRRYWLVLLLLSVTLVSVLVAFGCSKSSDDENGGGDDDDDTPTVYDPTMIGWAFGNGVYSYDQGRWNEEDVSPSGSEIVGAIFVNREQGLVYTAQSIYRYESGGWINITPASFPGGALLFDATRTGDGSFWFAANDAQNNGYLIRLALDGSELVAPASALFGGAATRLTSLATVPGDKNIYFTAEVNLTLLVGVWDGAQAVVTDPIVAQTPDFPLDVLDLTWGPDNHFWVVGYDQVDGPQQGIIWHRTDEGWIRQPLVASSDCQTTSARRIQFIEGGIGYIIADCLWSQIYRSSDQTNWAEMSLPGDKTDYRVNDISLLSDTRGWAVGYTGAYGGPLFLLRNAEGWMQATPETFGAGDGLRAVAVFDLPEPGPDDDTVVDDDTVADDDIVTDDDTVADDDLLDNNTTK